MPSLPAPSLRSVRFTLEDAQRAADDFKFNCGPGALCAALNLTPAEIRPHLQRVGFEQKGYMSPTMMNDALRILGVPHQQTYRSEEPGPLPAVTFGLVRVQFGGPWCAPGVPMAARYHHTHWAVIAGSSGRGGSLGDDAQAFDINAMCAGGWVPFREWWGDLIPWLIGETTPKSDGSWWLTHVLEVTPDAR